jgi:hypothetical protein
MATDIHPFIMGPHALASMNARTKALKAYGINPQTLIISQSARFPTVKESKIRALAKISTASRALAVQWGHELMNI